MPVLLQITLGTILLMICTFMHIFVATRVIRWLRQRTEDTIGAPKNGSILVITGVITVLLCSHTLHLYIWAGSIWALGALQGYEDSIYFSLVTYTTVGYGDVTLGDEFRIFGAMASVTGILLFGFTTAFLVGFFSELIRSAEGKD